jgi:hypothetical protein
VLAAADATTAVIDTTLYLLGLSAVLWRLSVATVKRETGERLCGAMPVLPPQR